MATVASALSRRARSACLLPLLLGLGACALRPPSISVPGPGELTQRVRALLSWGDGDSYAAEYRQARIELEAMGPEIDTVLVTLAYDPRARPVQRANALVLLADRRSPAALSTLRWALLTSDDDIVRAAAVMGLHRLGSDAPEALNAIRSAVSDPSPRVRLNALQVLDVHDIATVRALVRREHDPRVRTIGLQLLALAEARGAPLTPDADGVYRTVPLEGQARLVFYPRTREPRWEYVRGELGLEPGDGSYLRLAQDVEMVRGVLPAFFSADRTSVVFEEARHIVVRDLERRETMYLGPGIAPRPIPFTDAFVYLRERVAERRETPQGTELVYDVLRSRFGGSAPERIGELRALARPDRFGYLSPVRWMTVGETADGWLLQVDGEPAFELTNRAGADEPGSGDLFP